MIIIRQHKQNINGFVFYVCDYRYAQIKSNQMEWNQIKSNRIQYIKSNIYDPIKYNPIERNIKTTYRVLILISIHTGSSPYTNMRRYFDKADTNERTNKCTGTGTVLYCTKIKSNQSKFWVVNE